MIIRRIGMNYQHNPADYFDAVFALRFTFQSPRLSHVLAPDVNKFRKIRFMAGHGWATIFNHKIRSIMLNGTFRRVNFLVLKTEFRIPFLF